jgi:hypothetical protein
MSLECYHRTVIALVSFFPHFYRLSHIYLYDMVYVHKWRETTKKIRPLLMMIIWGIFEEFVEINLLYYKTPVGILTVYLDIYTNINMCI